MGKGQDAKKNVKKEAAKTPKEKKAEKRLKKAMKNQQISEKTSYNKRVWNDVSLADTSRLNAIYQLDKGIYEP